MGTYRISINANGESEITARAGDVEVFTPRGTQWVSAGQTMMARGTAADPEFQMAQAAPPDDWDRWSDSRDRPQINSQSAQYVPPGVYGTADLDPYGNWVNDPTYGYVWSPAVAPGWAPYQNGRWVWLDWYGWTWVSYDPWGWAPYHYGRWFYAGNRWMWYPGAIGVRHYWSPALVAFFGFGGGGVSFGFGNVGWVPLAPYEVLHPWWGRAYYGRTAYINRPVNVVNINVWNTYRNARVTNGFTAVRGEDFRAGRFNQVVRASGEQLQQASFVRGPIPVAPDRANLRFSDRQAAVTPRASGNTRVFSYRQPAPAQRIPFADQRRGFEQAGIATPSTRGNGFGGTSEVRLPGGVSNQAAPVRGSQPGWQRFGEPRAPQAQVAPQIEPRQVEPAGPQSGIRGANGYGNSAPVPAGNRGWSRFGDPGAARPEYRTTPQAQPQSEFRYQEQRPAEEPVAPNRAETLRMMPQIVRERPNNGGGGYNAPPPQMRQPSGGSFGSPRSSGGGYSAPRGEARGSSGGGSRGNSGGGNRGGGGGGGHHR